MSCHMLNKKYKNIGGKGEGDLYEIHAYLRITAHTDNLRAARTKAASGIDRVTAF